MPFTNGRILGSMCSAPHPLAAEVYLKYLEKNIGDPGLVPGLLEVEQEAIDLIGQFLGLDEAAGRIVTGGTEANLLALWTARRLEGGSKDEVILPATSHFSFDKAASLMGLKLVKIPVDAQYRVRTDLVAQAIGPRTLALVGIAGTTGLGATDDITALSDLALRHNLYLHVDASFGGFVLPFLRDAGYPTAPFDFSLPGVSSLAIDPHKMGRGPIPSGCILFRNKDLASSVNIPVKYLSGGKTKINTLVGTRSGATAAAVWALLKHLGRDGYTAIVKQAMATTRTLEAELRKIPGVSLMLDPAPMNVVGLAVRGLTAEELARLLRQRGWALSQWNDYLRIVVMPHVTDQLCRDFVADLKNLLA